MHVHDVRTAFAMIADILYPPRCPVCDGIVPWKRDICPECERKLPRVDTARCRICGSPVEDGMLLCDDCMEMKHSFDSGMGIFIYDDTMRHVIAAFKYKERREYGHALGRLIVDASGDLIENWKPDVIVPIPIHKERLAERGYNQAEILAEEVSERTGIPMRSDILVRKGRTAAMKNLNREERRANMVSAFAVPPGAYIPETVLIIDDIYTTGATIDAASSVLKKCGAGRVFFLTVCTGAGFMVKF